MLRFVGNEDFSDWRCLNRDLRELAQRGHVFNLTRNPRFHCYILRHKIEKKWISWIKAVIFVFPCYWMIRFVWLLFCLEQKRFGTICRKHVCPGIHWTLSRVRSVYKRLAHAQTLCTNRSLLPFKGKASGDTCYCWNNDWEWGVQMFWVVWWVAPTGLQ